MAKTKPLSAESIKKLQEKLIAEDLFFAERLHSLQDRYFPSRLKDIHQWSEAEKIKRLIIGLHDKQGVDVSGVVEHKIKVEFVK